MNQNIKINKKPFNPWNTEKQEIDNLKPNKNFREGEIWWGKLGINIGIEQNGKSEKFTRPVLILKKYNKHHFLAIPLTTKETPEKFSFHLSSDVSFLKKESWIVFSQIKAVDSKRLDRRMGKLPTSIFKNIQKKLILHLS